MGDRHQFSTRLTCRKIFPALTLQIAKMAHAFSIFGQTKNMAPVSFLHFTLNTNST